MARLHDVYTTPSLAVFRWLTEPDSRVPQRVRGEMLGRLFTAPRAVVIAMLNGLVLNVVGMLVDGGPVFLAFTILDALLAGARLLLIRHAMRAARDGRRTPTDLLLGASMLWCLLQGAMSFAAMVSGIRALQVLSASTIMALLGPICARNYAAPRWALLLLAACDLPFVAGTAASGDPWLWVAPLEMPLFLLASMSVIRQFQQLSVVSMLAEQESHERARHDHLTGLPNRLALAEAVADTGSGCRPFTLFCLDLDGFKAVNDTFGHPAGDRLLQQVSARLQAATRAQDVVARLGGDEFVVLACGLPPASSAAFAESIIRRIAGLPYHLGPEVSVRVGVSVGFACAPEDGTVLPELLACADAALYQSKAAGKGVQHRFTRKPVHEMA